MEKSNTKNNNKIYQNDSFTALFMFISKLKKYLALYLAVAIIGCVFSLCYSLIHTTANKPELKALVGFSYDGIDKGLDPNGRKFDINTLKSPAVIEMALTELNIDMNKLEDIRNGISFEEIIPANSYDEYTIYNSILEKGGGNSLDAGQKLLETSYYPTRFTVKFNYSKVGFGRKEAAEIFNVILKKYDDYFYKTYGYNESLGNAVSAITYEDYDYAEAVDVFSNSLNMLKKYVKNLADEDDTRFRSTATGYTFDDLYSSINTVQTIDLDNLSSYIMVNNLTKNKDKSIAYYEYRIDALMRDKESFEEQIDVYKNAIQEYEKDQLIVFGNTEDVNTQANISSEEYDKMFSQRNDIAIELADTKKQIEFYRKRLTALKTSSANSKVNIEEVKSELALLSEKVNSLINIVSDTAEDYYRNVTFGNAYNILVPASSSVGSKAKLIFETMKLPLIIIEAIVLFIYFTAAFIKAFAPKKEELNINDDSIEISASESKEKQEI